MTDAYLAAALFAVDPLGTGGVALRSRWGPARDDFLAFLAGLLPEGTPLRRLPPGIADDRLLGGLDLAATLQARRPVVERGLLAEADRGVVLMPMAERLAPSVVARLTTVLDAGSVIVERDGVAARHAARIGVVALDESLTEDERLPSPLGDRLAFHVALDDAEPDLSWHRDQVAEARGSLAAVSADHKIVSALCETALALGIVSMRAPILALRAARAHAALQSRRHIDQSDAVVGARLVLAPRALRLPADPASAPDSPTPDQPSADRDSAVSAMEAEPTDLILAAVRAAIPAHLLASLKSSQAVSQSRSSAGRSGSPTGSTGRGRPAGARQGRPGGRSRLNILATLRAAAPWQALRGARSRLEIRPDDFRITRVKRRTASATIFVVDASGSAAVSRLAEAKGAVELLLADCYVRRDEVALIAFRGRAPEIVVPPTRSLVRAKRCLSGLPGGGATPLAAAIDMAGIMAQSIAKKGQLPLIVFLTDGKANMTRDGRPGAAEAEREATAAARLFRASGTTALVVDTSPRPRPQSERLAADMGARYLPLPYAGSQELSGAIQASMRRER
jgi:magnesium chelatase subunit D